LTKKYFHQVLQQFVYYYGIKHSSTHSLCKMYTIRKRCAQLVDNIFLMQKALAHVFESVQEFVFYAYIFLYIMNECRNVGSLNGYYVVFVRNKKCPKSLWMTLKCIMFTVRSRAIRFDIFLRLLLDDFFVVNNKIVRYRVCI
jgi:hypothetical protein